MFNSRENGQFETVFILNYFTPDTLACAPNPCLNNGTCEYVGEDAEIDCVCPDGYVGDLCQYQGWLSVLQRITDILLFICDYVID